MKFGYILTILFAWTLYTRDVFRERTNQGRSSEATTYSLETRETKRREHKRHYRRGKWRKRERALNQRLKSYSTKPKAARFHNQRSLRRMYRNG